MAGGPAMVEFCHPLAACAAGVSIVGYFFIEYRVHAPDPGKRRPKSRERRRSRSGCPGLLCRGLWVI